MGQAVKQAVEQVLAPAQCILLRPTSGKRACRQWTTHSQTSTQEMCVPMPTHICLYTCHTAGANDIPAMTELRKGQARQGQAMVEHGGALAQVALLCVHVHMCLRC